MLTCDGFREECRQNIDSAEGRAHVRACATCLEFAVSIDPDYLFRSIGGEDLVPPGGVDAFVGDVMQQVHVRRAEASMHRVVRFPAMARWSVAATLAAAVIGAAIWYRPATQAPLPVTTVAAARPSVPAVATMARPVVENYESPNAMIVEVPTESDNDLKIVMIFDESLPVDL